MAASSSYGTKPTVAEWFTGRTLLVTGGTGFMGKVLLEKLLRSCSDLKRILVLVRPKRGSDPRHRIQEMLLLPLFAKLRAERPDVLSKLVAVEGDVTKPGLGLSDTDREAITRDVSVVFHCAASLHMETGFKRAVEHNVVSTLRLLELADEMSQLAVFMHLSTMFCQCEQEVVEEEMYPPPAPYRDIIKMVNSMEENELEDLVPSLLGNHPNIYTYTKRLAESLVEEWGRKLPTVIVRPSIVMPTWRDPIPGWVDSLNGPVGILVAVGKGVLRSMIAGKNANAEVIPVDIAINALISIAWTVGTNKLDGVPVYNLTQGATVPITWGEVRDIGCRVMEENPFEGAVWYPDGRIISNKWAHTLVVVLLHYLPAYFIDLLLLLLGRKRFMVQLQHRITAGMRVLEYFSMRRWNFRNDKFLSLEASLCEEDRVTFHMRADDEIDRESFIRDIVLGARQYCMKEPLSSLPQARRHLAMLYYIHKATVYAVYALLGWLLFHALVGVLDSSDDSLKPGMHYLSSTTLL